MEPPPEQPPRRSYRSGSGVEPSPTRADGSRSGIRGADRPTSLPGKKRRRVDENGIRSYFVGRLAPIEADRTPEEAHSYPVIIRLICVFSGDDLTENEGRFQAAGTHYAAVRPVDREALGEPDPRSACSHPGRSARAKPGTEARFCVGRARPRKAPGDAFPYRRQAGGNLFGPRGHREFQAISRSAATRSPRIGCGHAHDRRGRTHPFSSMSGVLEFRARRLAAALG